MSSQHLPPWAGVCEHTELMNPFTRKKPIRTLSHHLQNLTPKRHCLLERHLLFKTGLKERGGQEKHHLVESTTRGGCQQVGPLRYMYIRNTKTTAEFPLEDNLWRVNASEVRAWIRAESYRHGIRHWGELKKLAVMYNSQRNRRRYATTSGF